MTGPLSDLRLLIVEDEMVVLMNIEATLEDMGCTRISAAATVVEALTLIEEGRFDAAIIDINLSGERSYPVADALARRAIPFAFSTGYGELGERADFVDRPVLRKPYVRRDLIAVVQSLVPAGPFHRAA
jgi:CheY-like chemotaxis protein